MMRHEGEATFDGSVYRPTGPPPEGLPPGAKVRVTWEPPGDDEPPKPGEPGYFLWLVSQAKLDLPPDYSVNWEKYLEEEEAERANRVP